LTDVPYFHPSSPLKKADDCLSKADRVPWIGTHVIITKVGHPLKGCSGVVKDVLPGQDTASGLKIFVQLTHYNPSAPYMSIHVDYDDVVEKKSVYESQLYESVHTYYAYFKYFISTFGL
jgi:hypothetical protein